MGLTMTIIGILVIISGLVFWAGQGMVFIVPRLAERLGLCEPRETMEETFHIIESRSIPLLDLLTAWTMPLAGLMMILEHPIWPYLGLVGGGVFIYGAGAFVLSRVFLGRKGKRIGTPAAVKTAHVAGGVWILTGVLMIVLSSIELST